MHYLFSAEKVTARPWSGESLTLGPGYGRGMTVRPQNSKDESESFTEANPIVDMSLSLKTRLAALRIFTPTGLRSCCRVQRTCHRQPPPSHAGGCLNSA